MKTCQLLFLFFGILPFPVKSQMEGDTWVIGYYSNGSPEYSIMYLDFRSGYMVLSYRYESQNHVRETSANICDEEGDPLFWTNGMEINGLENARIIDTIAYEPLFPNYWDYYFLHSQNQPLGFPKPNGALILPIPDAEDEYTTIYHGAKLHPVGFFQIYKWQEARIKVNDSGYEILYQDSIFGKPVQWFNATISAARHANGRDWWLVSFEENSNIYYTYLLTPGGIHTAAIKTLDIPIVEGLGQTIFSQDGNYLARVDASYTSDDHIVTVFSFDRCTGDLSRLASFYTPTASWSGVAFSPSEQFLYATGDNNTKLWQWDLLAGNIVDSQILIDTFDGFVQPGWFQMRFGPMMQTPDGRIYVVPSAGSSEYLHVIERPDLPGKDCNFKQHSINLTKPNGRSAPNIPNFRLGPLDGSPCDTLGINNLPVSRWRYEEDVPGIVDIIRFTDQSFYNPDTWHWDFDNGSTSPEPSPLHDFDPGLYHVCLKVSNEYASDSSCQWIEILPTALKDEWYKEVHDLSISPNPFADELTVRSRSGSFREAVIHLYNMHGHAVISQLHLPVPISIKLPSLSPGMYLCVIRDIDGSVYQQKVMKL